MLESAGDRRSATASRLRPPAGGRGGREAQLDHEYRGVETETYASHPSLPERIAAVQDIPPARPTTRRGPSTPCGTRPRSAASRGVPDRDAGLAGTSRPSNGTPSAMTSTEPGARELSTHVELSEGDTFGTLADAVANLGGLAGTVTEPDVEDRCGLAAGVIGDGVAGRARRGRAGRSGPPAEPVGGLRGGDFAGTAHSGRGDADEGARRRRSGMTASANWESTGSSCTRP